MAQQVVSSGGVCAHCEGEDAMGTSESSGTLNESLADGGQLLEGPQRRTLFRRGPLGFGDLHLKLSVEVVSQDRGQEIGLVAKQGSSGYIIHLALGLQLGEDRLLGAAPVVKGHDVTSSDGLVGDHHLKFIVVGIGDEEIKLDRPMRASRSDSTDDKHPKVAVPTLGFPMRLEVGDVGVEAPPEAALLDGLLELGKALERHGNREIDAELVQRCADGVTEEGAVHSHLNVHTGQSLSDFVDTGEDEFAGSMRIVNVAGPEEKVENLAGLCDGTEERVVASLALFLPIESHRRALSPAVGAEHRAVEVESDAAQSETGETLQDKTAEQVPELLDHAEGHMSQDPADRGNVGQSAKLQQPQDQGIVMVEAGISKMSVAEKDMNHETEQHGGIAIGARALELAEALTELGREIETNEEGLKQDQAGEGGQLLVLESELGKSTGFTFDLHSAKLHRGDLLRVGDRFSGKNDSSPSWSLFPFQTDGGSTSPMVRLRIGAQCGANSHTTGALSYLSAFSMQLEGNVRHSDRHEA